MLDLTFPRRHWAGHDLAAVERLLAGRVWVIVCLPAALMRQSDRFNTMKATLRIALGTAGFVLTLLAIPALAEYTEREKRDCQKDYHAYCGEYGLGTEALRACMSRNIKKVSHACVGALVDSGEMTKAQANKLRGSHKASTASKKKKTTSKKTTHKKVTSKSSTKKK